jgi:hypothetical protein
MKLAKIIAALGVLAMTAALFNGFTRGDFAAEGAKLLEMPWGQISLVDLYTGFILFSIWIVFREKTIWKAALWVVLMMILGFFAGALYMFIALQTSKGSWRKFWMGERSELT